MSSFSSCGRETSGWQWLALTLLSLGCGLVDGSVTLPGDDLAPADGSAVEPLDSAASESTTADWLASTELAIANSEYRFRPTSDARQVHATNRAHDLRAVFSAQGLAMESRVKPETGNFSLALAAWGRDGKLEHVVPAAPVVGKCMQEGRLDEHGECLRRLEYVRPNLVEYWDNVPDGLEQGWEISQPVAGSGELVLSVRVAGATLSYSPKGVLLQTSAGFRVGYTEAMAWDRDHRPLPTQLVIRGDAIEVRVDDSAASYPIVIDPTLDTPPWSFTVDEPWLGSFMEDRPAMAGGDVNGDGYGDLILGRPYFSTSDVEQNGKAYLFLGSATGLKATPEAWLGYVPHPGSIGATWFGAAIATADFNNDGYCDVIIGEPNGIPNGTSYSMGGAYIFLGSAGGLANAPDVTLRGEQVNSFFGASVTAADFTGDGYADVIVGAPQYSSLGVNSRDGAAYAFLGSASGVSTTPAWTKISGVNGIKFGHAVASAGDVNGDGKADFLVSAPYYGTNKGRVYGYKGVSTGAFGNSSVQYTATDANNRQGSSIAAVGDLSGDGYGDFVIGNSLYNSGGGRIEFYRGSSAGFPAAHTQAINGTGKFGAAAAGIGDINGDGYLDVAVGSPGDVTLGVYAGTPAGNLSETPRFSLGRKPFDKDSVGFGTAVVGVGDVNADGFADVVVSAPWTSTTRPTVYLFLGEASDVSAGIAPPPAPRNHISSPFPSSQRFAQAVAGAGDVNGDGFADVLVGAPYFDDGQPGAGKAYLYLGSATGMATTPAWGYSSASVDAHFGAAVASAGDVNGDGLADVIIGAPDFGAGQFQEGRTFVFHGVATATGLQATPAWTTEINQIGAHHGAAVASAGDVNGDGFVDVVVGAPGFDNGQTDEGSLRTYHGSATGLSTTASRTFESNVAGAHLGSAVAGGADVNRDGYADIAAGAPDLSAEFTAEGRVYVLYGSSSGIAATAAWSEQSHRDNTNYGAKVAMLDVNGDGYGDLVIAAPAFDDLSTGLSNVGRAYLYVSTPGSGLGSASWFYQGSVTDTKVATSLSSAGDLNGDGFGDFVVGTPFYDPTSTAANNYRLGRVYAFYGSRSGPPNTPSLTVTGKEKSQGLGASLAGVGDVNGDGFGDLVIGSNNEFGPIPYSGSVDLFLCGPLDAAGAPSNNTLWRPRLLRSGSSTQLLLAWNKAPTRAFDFRFDDVRPAVARGKVKVWIDAQPLGTAFGPGASASDWSSTFGSTTDLLGSKTGLTANKSYHVRARVVGDPASGFIPAASRWFYGSAWGDALGTHFRTP